MARTISRLYGPAQLASTSATLYTVPTATKTIVRHIHVSNPSASPVTLTLSIGTDAAGVRLFDGYSIAANSTFDHYPVYALAAGEIIAANAGTASVLVITIDGEVWTL